MTIHLRNVIFLDWRTGDLHEGSVTIDDAIRLIEKEPAADDRVIDCAGRLAMKGLVCGHHHLYSGLARGMPAPPRAPRNFLENLELIWWRIDRALDLDMIRGCALAAGMDALHCGVTSIIDHHASPHCVPGSLATLAIALDELGLSHVLCYELSDRDGPESAAAGLTETDVHLSSGHPGLVGLHASFTVGDELLGQAVDLARKHQTGIHIHVAEDRIDEDRCIADHRCRVADRLHGAGVLDLPGTLLGHCLHLDAAERALVDASGAWVVANVESNLKNAVGQFRREGLPADRILLGTDGMHGDMLRSGRTAWLLGRMTDGLEMDAAWAELWRARQYLEAHHPAAARANDLVLFDYVPPTPLDATNFLGHVYFGLDARHVHTVVAGGKIVVDDRELTTIDESEARAYCAEQARRLWAVLEQD